MSFDGKVKQWKCVKGGTVHFQKMSSIVRDIGEPCLHQSPIKISKMLKRDKWEATFDDEGKILGFNKVLKLIVLGGVEPSIRPEVWEFLLGCYSLSSTAEYRQQLRAARRERYKELVKQCQVMHSSVGTGTLAYAVGSKVMDMRMSSKEAVRRPEVQNGRISETSPNKIGDTCNFDTNCKDKNYRCQKKSYSDSGDLLRFRAGTAGVTYDSSDLLSTTETSYCGLASAYDADEPHSVPRCFLDFPALPVEDLFEENTRDRKPYRIQGDKSSRRRKLTYDDLPMHSFQISNNEDLVVEANRLSSDDISPCVISKCEINGLDIRESLSRSTNLEYENEILDRLKMSDTLGMPRTCANLPQGSSSDDRVSEWLWTLHQIVVDVVRTDSHLEFYEDTKNLARMSDILAVYAWADPATGYCQGMSDLLSPFVVLYEDDGDAFWCFEMLLRKMRENFQIEGPTGVLKQLEALWSILELTDREMFSHLSFIGAESLHFAFRMLLVLFRRELSFNEALRMWEMIWAADFDSSLSCHLDESCLELLAIELPNDAEAGSGEEYTDSSGVSMHGAAPKNGSMLYPISAFSGIGSLSTRPFCGLTKGLWSRNDHFQNRKVLSSTRNADDELPVFCVAAILIMNRQKIIRETHSIDDLIKIFNDNLLKIRVKRCVRTAIKLRKKYFRKLFKNGNLEAQNGGHV